MLATLFIIILCTSLPKTIPPPISLYSLAHLDSTCSCWSIKSLFLLQKKKNTSLSLKVQFNHWPFPRDLPWQSRSRGISSSPVSFTWPLSHSASSLHFLGWRNMRTWTRVSHLSNEDYNPLPPFCWMRYFKLPITCLINHSTCIHSHVASHVCLNIL